MKSSLVFEVIIIHKNNCSIIIDIFLRYTNENFKSKRL